MNKGLYLAMFATGALVGSLITWQYTKKKYEQLAQEEIDSVKKTFSRMNNINKQDDIQEKVNEPIKEDITDKKVNKEKIDYVNVLKNNDYTKEENKMIGEPYVISPEEFGEIEEYETVSLTYYADRILTDDMDNIVDDVEELVGYESLNHFGEYEDDSVFVRNDEKQCDYEILLDVRKYEDVYSGR